MIAYPPGPPADEPLAAAKKKAVAAKRKEPQPRQAARASRRSSADQAGQENRAAVKYLMWHQGLASMWPRSGEGGIAGILPRRSHHHLNRPGKGVQPPPTALYRATKSVDTVVSLWARSFLRLKEIALRIEHLQKICEASRVSRRQVDRALIGARCGNQRLPPIAFAGVGDDRVFNILECGQYRLPTGEKSLLCLRVAHLDGRNDLAP